MNPQHQQHELTKINVHELMEKVQSKRDVYNFLTQECEAYLPNIDTINIFFLKKIRISRDQRPRMQQCPR